MVQNLQTRLCTDLAITSGTSQTTDQYYLGALTRTRPGPYGLDTVEGTRDIGVGQQLYLRFRITESFDQPASTLDVVPTIASTVDMTAPISIEHYRARLIGSALVAGATWHFPLRPISTSEALTAALAPIWPTQMQYIGAKFVVAGGPAFTAGKVTCDITPHMSPDGDTTFLGAKLPPKMSAAGW